MWQLEHFEDQTLAKRQTDRLMPIHSMRGLSPNWKDLLGMLSAVLLRSQSSLKKNSERSLSENVAELRSCRPSVTVGELGVCAEQSVH